MAPDPDPDSVVPSAMQKLTIMTKHTLRCKQSHKVVPVA